MTRQHVGGESWELPDSFTCKNCGAIWDWQRALGNHSEDSVCHCPLCLTPEQAEAEDFVCEDGMNDIDEEMYPSDMDAEDSDDAPLAGGITLREILNGQYKVRRFWDIGQ